MQWMEWDFVFTLRSIKGLLLGDVSWFYEVLRYSEDARSGITYLPHGRERLHRRVRWHTGAETHMTTLFLSNKRWDRDLLLDHIDMHPSLHAAAGIWQEMESTLPHFLQSSPLSQILFNPNLGIRTLDWSEIQGQGPHLLTFSSGETLNKNGLFCIFKYF